MAVGSTIAPVTEIVQCMREKRPVNAEVYNEEYDIHAAGRRPVFDERDKDKVIGTFGLSMPRAVAVRLQNMSNDLTKELH